MFSFWIFCKFQVEWIENYQLQDIPIFVIMVKTFIKKCTL